MNKKTKIIIFTVTFFVCVIATIFFISKNTHVEALSKYGSRGSEVTQIQSKLKSQEKKSWELEPEEKAKIQRETAEIAKRFREQEKQQKQVPTQEIKQGNMQQGDFTQIQQGQISQQIPQQPLQDFGGMEL